MIDHWNIYNGSGLHELPRDRDVRGRGGPGATRMVMGHNNATSTQQQGIAKDDFAIDETGTLRARGNELISRDLVRLIEHQHQDMFLIIIQGMEDRGQDGILD